MFLNAAVAAVTAGDASKRSTMVPTRGSVTRGIQPRSNAQFIKDHNAETRGAGNATASKGGIEVTQATAGRGVMRGSKRGEVKVEAETRKRETYSRELGLESGGGDEGVLSNDCIVLSALILNWILNCFRGPRTV